MNSPCHPSGELGKFLFLSVPFALSSLRKKDLHVRIHFQDDKKKKTGFFFRHCLVVFGGVKGLEDSLDADPDLRVADPSLLFNHYLNTCPGQGSHTIRTEVSVRLYSINISLGMPSNFLSGNPAQSCLNAVRVICSR